MEKRKKHTGPCLKVYLHDHCGQWQQVEREWARAMAQQREEVPRDPGMVAGGPQASGILVASEDLKMVKRTKDV